MAKNHAPSGATDAWIWPTTGSRQNDGL